MGKRAPGGWLWFSRSVVDVYAMLETNSLLHRAPLEFVAGRLMDSIVRGNRCTAAIKTNRLVGCVKRQQKFSSEGDIHSLL
ncbi:hypothetical protein VTO42DRAFT_6183 [Malbranchea cinnamomea]